MGLQFRRSSFIPDFVYKTSVLPKTLDQCHYLLEQKQLEMQAIKERCSVLKLQHQLAKDNEHTEELLDLASKIRTIRNAQSTISNQIVLLFRWKEDFLNIDDGSSVKTRNKLTKEISALKVQILEMDAKIQATAPLKRLAAQVEQFAKYFAQFIFIPSKPVSPSQLLELQQIARDVSGKPPDPNFAELMQPFIEKSKIDRLKRKASTIE